MKAVVSISFGTEVDVEQARTYIKHSYGSEYSEDMTDEECVKAWAHEKFNKGIGCEVIVDSLLDNKKCVFH